MPTAISSALVGFPDIEHVPIYPNASVTTATNQDVTSMQVVYEVSDRIDKVQVFYQDMLTKKGWLLRSSEGQASLYSWIDPARKSPWHLRLEVVIGFTLDESKTLVSIEYGRYPDTEDGLPLYPDAQQAATTHSDTEKSFLSEKVPVHVTDTIYLSSASPQEVAHFYNNSMLQYGWSFFDRSTPGPSDVQTGSINSQEGMYFKSNHLGWGMTTIVSDELFVTATVEKDGRTLVKLHVEEMESSLGNF